MMFIYCIENKINSKRYIGKTKNIAKRWKDHVYRSLKCNSRCHFHRAIRKYNPENFVIYVIKKCQTEKELNCWEKKYIKKFNTLEKGYNETTGGEGAMPSLSTIKKIRQKANERYKNGKTQILQSIAAINRWKNPTLRKQRSDSMKGLKHPRYKKSLSKTHKDKMSRNHSSSIPILCVNNNIVYHSVRKAARQLKLNHQNICRVLKGMSIHTGNYKFKIIEGVEDGK